MNNEQNLHFQKFSFSTKDKLPLKRFSNPIKNASLFVFSLFICFTFLSIIKAQAADNFKIEEAKWDSDKSHLKVKGKGSRDLTVTISNADTALILGDKQTRKSEWKIAFRNPESIPCRVKAEQSNGETAERFVRNAPADCDDGNNQPPTDPPVGSAAIRMLAANDLGMHCADKDYQIFSILPPFNVVHAQAILKGTGASLPKVLTNMDVDVNYSAASNPDDPAGANSINTSSNIAGVFKTNFWDKTGTSQVNEDTLGGLTYGRLYPSVLAGVLLDPPQNFSGLCNGDVCPSILNLFEPIPIDMGIPVPELGDLANGVLTTFQQAMPGPNNDPQLFKRFDKDVHFFGNTIHDTNWFVADGIPILPVDDAGNSNAYPLMKVSAVSKTTGDTLDSVDLVLPVASEADCQNCHADPDDHGNGSASTFANTPFSVVSVANAPGPEPLGNAAKMNILRLHDAKHGANYTSSVDGSPTVCDAANDPDDPNCIANQTPIQCAQCHYTPALDLTQGGPVDDTTQGIKGRQQTRHISMSRAMHLNHAEYVPEMPQADHPDRTTGPAINDFEQGVLEASCYQCHPGTNTQCLRGAMFTGGTVCQDCHGGMKQVGNDYSGDHPETLEGATKRIPWASEPKCQSCHTGDAYTPNHPEGGIVAKDGIRLIQAYLKDDETATPISAMASRFAENQSLYRLSGSKDGKDKGHGGVMCEGCHGSTHAIWPNINPFANDNVTSNQIQGHTGTIAECSSCHAEGTLGNTLGGPHGMHPVGGGEFADGGHEKLGEEKIEQCRACHGNNGEGTVLSKVSMDRSFTIEKCEKGTLCPGDEIPNFKVNLKKGEQVTCVMCHKNQL